MSRIAPLLAVWMLVAGCGGAQAHELATAPPEPLPASPPAKPVEQAFAEKDPDLSFRDTERRRKLEATFPAVDAAAQRALERQNLPGLVVGIVVDGELVHVKGLGVIDLEKKTAPDADTVFGIGSITKSFTGLLLLSLRDEGLLSLDEPITRLLPEAGGIVYPSHDAAPITLRQLATHTSGVPRCKSPTKRVTTSLGCPDVGDPEPTEEALLKQLDGLALESAPGAKFSYSNLGYALLGIVVSRAAHAPYQEVLRTRLLKPLGMNHTFLDEGEVPEGLLATPYHRSGPSPVRKTALVKYGAFRPAGGLFTSMRDLSRYAAFELSGDPPRSEAEAGPVRRSTLRESHQAGFFAEASVRAPVAPAKGAPFVNATAQHYGFGWFAERSCAFDDLVWHNGAVPGFSAGAYLLPERGVAVLVLTNVWTSDPDSIGDQLLDAIDKGGGLSKRALAPAPELDVVMRKLMALYASWDEDAYGALLTKGRPKMATEQGELAGYKKLHGACAAFELASIDGPRAARYKVSCERGDFEMQVSLGADGLMQGFSGTSRGEPVEPQRKKVAEAFTKLITKWDEALFRKHLASSLDHGKTRDDLVAFFDGLRAAHGACTVKSQTFDGPNEKRIVLACERGDVDLDLELDKKQPDVARRYMFSNAPSKNLCPVR